jgi:hypothetical protein
LLIACTPFCVLQNSGIVKNLTYVLILHPIGAGLAGLAAIFGLFGVCSSSRAATVMMTLASSLAMIVTLVALVVDLVSSSAVPSLSSHVCVADDLLLALFSPRSCGVSSETESDPRVETLLTERPTGSLSVLSHPS